MMSDNELHETVTNIAKRQSTITNFQLLQLAAVIASIVTFYYKQKADTKDQFDALNKRFDNRHTQDTLNYVSFNGRISGLDARVSALEDKPIKKVPVYDPQWFIERKDKNGKIHRIPTTN